MSQQSSETSRDPLRSSWLVLVLLVMIVIPAVITLNTVRFPGTLEISNPNPTPFGYTLSLSLFIVPIIVIGGWLVPSERLAFPRRAFWWTIGLLVPVSFGLDFFFGNTFFVFPNPGATLGIGAPALGGSVPVEEYVFYLTGFSTVLLIYILAGRILAGRLQRARLCGGSREDPPARRVPSGVAGRGLGAGRRRRHL